MAGMQRALRLTRGMALALGFLIPVAAAQQPSNKPAQQSPGQQAPQSPNHPAQQPAAQPAPEPGNPYDDSKPYAPPAPWKSVEIGNYYFKKRNLKAALSRYKEAVQTDPHYSPGYLGMGKVYERMRLRRKALEAYQHYLDELPSTKDALEAKEVQKAMARLEKDLKRPASTRAKPAPPSTGAERH